MADNDDIQCGFSGSGQPVAPADRLYSTNQVTAFELAPKYTNDIIFGDLITTKLYLVCVIHIAAEADGDPIIDNEYIEEVFKVANGIWAQACIELAPHFDGIHVPGVKTLSLQGFVGCLTQGPQREIVDKHNIVIPDGQLVVNVWFVREANFACGDPRTAEVFLPIGTHSIRSAEFMGNVLAHELGHILLNPMGVDDSPNPDHLMHHPSRYPDVPAGSNNGLFLSECLGARTRAKEDLFAFSRPGGFGGGLRGEEPESCLLCPKLGNNFAFVATNVAFTKVDTALTVESFTLINAAKDEAIAEFDPIEDGATINLSTLETQELNIRANVGDSVSSVRLILSKGQETVVSRLEGVAPYSLFGDVDQDYSAGTLVAGEYRLEARPYSENETDGLTGQGLTITFSVTDNS